jgi:D-aminopeptidase
VLVQSNFGGSLRVNGVPVSRELARLAPDSKDGSCMIVVATDAPLTHRNLQRLAYRALWGMARTGAAGSNGSGDYAIAFSTQRGAPELSNEAASPLFAAVIEATEEAILNSLWRAETMTGNGHTVRALPLEQVRLLMR